MGIQVKDFMSTPVATAIGQNSVKEARALMAENGINALPVISNAEDKSPNEMTIRGIITATDISKEVVENATVEEVMTSSSVHVVHVASSAKAAAKMMLKHKVHHLVAMEDGEIKGMLSSLDFVKLAAAHSME